MLKLILATLVQTIGLREINSTLADICNSRISPYKDHKYNTFYDKLSEAYDKLNEDFFEFYEL